MRNTRKRIGFPKFVLLNCEGDGGNSGSGDGKFTQADLDKAVDAAVQGLKDKNSELLGKVTDASKALKAWEGLEPDKVRALLDKVENDEVLKLHTEGKHDEAYNKRMEKERSTWQAKLDAAATDITGHKDRADKLEIQVRDLIIDQQVLTSFMAEKGIETAGPDVVLRARAAFKIEDGVPIARDSAGKIINGKDGPLTPKEWVAGLKVSAPHLFPGSSGAGARDGNKGGGGSDIDSLMQAAAANNDMKEYNRLKAVKKKAAESNA